MNNIKKKINMISKNSTAELPSLYQKVDYIYRGDFWGYLETDILYDISKNYEIDMCARLTRLYDSGEQMSGWSNGLWFGTIATKINEQESETYFVIGGFDKMSNVPPVEINRYYKLNQFIDNENKQITITVDNNPDYRITAEQKYSGINGEPYHVFTAQYWRSDYLAGSGWRMYMDLKSLKIKEDGKIIADLIPCYRKSDNYAGLYNAVTGAFYCSQKISYGFD